MKSVISIKSSTTRSVTTTYTSWAIESIKTDHRGAAYIPHGKLLGLFMYFESLSSATSITWKITRDVEGDEVIVPENTNTLIIGQTTATDGSLAISLEEVGIYRIDQPVYIWVKSDAGTALGAEAIVTMEG